MKINENRLRNIIKEELNKEGMPMKDEKKKVTRISVYQSPGTRNYDVDISYIENGKSKSVDFREYELSAKDLHDMLRANDYVVDGGTQFQIDVQFGSEKEYIERLKGQYKPAHNIDLDDMNLPNKGSSSKDFTNESKEKNYMQMLVESLNSNKKILNESSGMDDMDNFDLPTSDEGMSVTSEARTLLTKLQAVVSGYQDEPDIKNVPSTAKYVLKAKQTISMLYKILNKIDSEYAKDYGDDEF